MFYFTAKPNVRNKYLELPLKELHWCDIAIIWIHIMLVELLILIPPCRPRILFHRMPRREDVRRGCPRKLDLE